MSAKSERKKKAYEAVKNTPAQPAQPPYQWFAENVQRELDKHKQHCTDLNCSEAIGLRFPQKMVAMVMNGDKKRLYLAPFGRDSKDDYVPTTVLQLETGEEIAGAFNEDGSVECMITGHNETDQPICLTLLCHREGVQLVVTPNEPDRVSVVCNVCAAAIKDEGILTRSMKLASTPKVEYPNIFCNYHGVQPKYLACCHVAHGEEPMILNRPSAEDVGLAFCSNECSRAFGRELDAHDKDSDVHSNSIIHVVCAEHLNQALGGKLEQYHQQADATAAA